MTAQLDTGAARTVLLRAGRTVVATLQAGPPTGVPLLLIPGYTGSKEDFGPILDPLADAGMRVVALDLPGQFESPALPTAQPYSTDELGRVVLAVAGTLGRRVRLLGHSFGGLVARAAVVSAPETFRSLVLLSSGPAAIGGARRGRIDRLGPVLAAGGLPAVWGAIRAEEADDPAAAARPPELTDLLRRRFLSGDPRMLRGMADALAHEPDRVGELSATGVPTLVVHGADDDAWPAPLQREMAGRLGADYAVVPAAAHSAAVENPTGLVAALRHFWRTSGR